MPIAPLTAVSPHAPDPVTLLAVPGSPQAPAVVVDGIIDNSYGQPIAVDPGGDGNGSSHMDLLELYMTEDADNFYFAYTINADINTTNWGKYVIYLDVDGVDNSGAPTDAWTRNVVVSNIEWRMSKTRLGSDDGTHEPPVTVDNQGQYTVVVMGQTDAIGNLQQIPAIWSFSTAGNPTRDLYLPLIGK